MNVKQKATSHFMKIVVQLNVFKTQFLRSHLSVMIKHLWFKLWVRVLNQGLPLVATKCPSVDKRTYCTFKAKTNYYWFSARIHKTLGRIDNSIFND